MIAQTPPILSHDLLETDGIAHGFFTRHGGISDGVYGSLNGGLGSNDDTSNVETNRAAAAATLGGTADDIRGLYQVHSATALVADNGPRREGDALVTDRPGLVLTILTADCAPVLFADPEAGVIGAAHAGWRGAVKGIIGSTIERMQSLGASLDRIRAVIGTTIQQASYQVGPDLRDEVITASPWAEPYFIDDDTPNHFRFDLPGYALSQLQQAGITAASMAEDTYADDRFFSHRRACHQNAPDAGRLMSMIRITP